MPPDKSAQVNLRLNPILKTRAEKAAAADHRSLTSLIEKLLADHLQGRSSLEDWHREAINRFEELAHQRGFAEYVTPRRYRAFSFAIRTGDANEIAPHQLLDAIRAVYGQMHGVFTSPQLFYTYTRSELLPKFVADNAGHEVMESLVSPDVANTSGSVDFWRIAPNGLVCHLKPYDEDTWAANPKLPEKWLWPFRAIRDLYELVMWAWLLGEQMQTAESVEFRCEWFGLSGRQLADNQPGIWTPDHVARADHRVTGGVWTMAEIRVQPNVVSALLAPVLRLFDPTLPCTADWVGEQTARFRHA